MPKRVDHEERRRQITEALLRTAAVRGLHATGMREVAAEAGVSLRLVQYYFGTKEELLLTAMRHLAVQFGGRVQARISRLKETEDPVHPRDVIAAILTEALPADEERRTFTVLYTAYFALSLTEPALAIAPLVRNGAMVIDVFAAQLRAAQAAGQAPAGLDPDAEALILNAMSAGLGTTVLAGHSSAEQAQAVIDYHLDRLFPAPRPALRRAPVKAAAAGRRAAVGTTPGSPVACGIFPRVQACSAIVRLWGARVRRVQAQDHPHRGRLAGAGGFSLPRTVLNLTRSAHSNCANPLPPGDTPERYGVTVVVGRPLP